jgi:hypothetical protein
MNAIFIKFSVPKNGKTSAANARYISRPSATLENNNQLFFHNLENLKGRDYRETRTNFISYAEARLDEEATKTQRGAGAARTHYRVVLSFDRNEGTEAAKELSQKWLKENFPDGRAAGAIHRDTKNLHIHVWVDARQTNDRKLNLDNKQYRKLDESWAKIYAERYGEKYLIEHLEKKSRKPADRERTKRTVDYKKREENNYDKAGLGAYKRKPSDEIKVLSRQKRAIDGGINRSERADRQIDERVRNSEQGKSQADEFERIRNESIERVNRLHGEVTELGKNLESERQREEAKSNVRVYERERVRERER